MRSLQPFLYEMAAWRESYDAIVRCPVCGEVDADFQCVETDVDLSIVDDHHGGEHGRCHPKACCKPSPLADIRTRAERGAALLDELVPDWPLRVNTGLLTMYDGCKCVMGQIGPNYTDAMQRVMVPEFHNPAGLGLSPNQHLDLIGFAHGFYSEREADYDVLDGEWTLLIQERVDSQ